jgi:hypothetical protein
VCEQQKIVPGSVHALLSQQFIGRHKRNAEDVPAPPPGGCSFPRA